MSNSLATSSSFGMVIAVLTAFLCCAGCGGGEKRVSVVQVDAKLVLDDKPFGPATLSLSPTKAESNVPPATGTASADGKLDLRTYADTAGIAPGEYNVTLLPDPMKIGHSPTAQPVTVSINQDTKSLEVKLTSKKRSRPGEPVGGGGP